MPGNMGMNAPARKIKLSLLLSSLPPSSPSLQTDDRSKLPPFTPLFFLHPSSLNHFSLSDVFIRQISASDDVSLHLYPSGLSLFPSPPPHVVSLFLRSFFALSALLHLSFSVSPCQCLPLFSSLQVMDSLLSFLFPFPLSSSLFPQVSNTRHNQSAAPSSLPLSIPKPLSPLCSPSFPRFPPVPSLLYISLPLHPLPSLPIYIVELHLVTSSSSPSFSRSSFLSLTLVKLNIYEPLLTRQVFHNPPLPDFQLLSPPI